MKYICVITSLLLAIVWGTGFFVFHASSLIHTLALLAVILGVHAVITTENKKYLPIDEAVNQLESS